MNVTFLPSAGFNPSTLVRARREQTQWLTRAKFRKWSPLSGAGVALGFEAYPGNVPAQDIEEYLEWVKVVGDFLPSIPGEVLDSATGTGFVAMIVGGRGHRVTAIALAAYLKSCVPKLKARA